VTAVFAYLGVKTSVIIIHLHCLVTGGGWDKETRDVEEFRKNAIFFSGAESGQGSFRGKYLAGLQQLFEQERLRFAGQIASVLRRSLAKSLAGMSRPGNWVVL